MPNCLEPLLEPMGAEGAHRTAEGTPDRADPQPESWIHRVSPAFEVALRDNGPRHEPQVATLEQIGARSCGKTSARVSAARNSEPVTQMSPVEGVNCRASSRASAGSP